MSEPNVLFRLISRCAPNHTEEGKQAISEAGKSLTRTWKTLHSSTFRCQHKYIQCCLETFLWEVRTSIFPPQIGYLQQTKETMLPKVRFVNQRSLWSDGKHGCLKRMLHQGRAHASTGDGSEKLHPQSSVHD